MYSPFAHWQAKYQKNRGPEIRVIRIAAKTVPTPIRSSTTVIVSRWQCWHLRPELLLPRFLFNIIRELSFVVFVILEVLLVTTVELGAEMIADPEAPEGIVTVDVDAVGIVEECV